MNRLKTLKEITEAPTTLTEEFLSYCINKEEPIKNRLVDDLKKAHLWNLWILQGRDLQ